MSNQSKTPPYDHPRKRFIDPKHFVIFDTEYTTWQGAHERHWDGDNEFREIVQIAAIKVDRQNFEEIDCLELLIKPRRNPVVSDYFVDLTGISREDVLEKGIDFTKAMHLFHSFAKHQQAMSYGEDTMILGENFGMVENFRESLYNIYSFNVAAVIHAVAPEVSLINSGRLADFFGVSVPHYAENHQHDALYDCRSILAALKHLRQTKPTEFACWWPGKLEA